MARNSDAVKAARGDGLNMKRRFGMKETRQEREQRMRSEKENKWCAKLAKEDLGKLQAELASLCRAEFLAPQQRERRRLVEKMVRDMEKREDSKGGESGNGTAKGSAMPPSALAVPVSLALSSAGRKHGDDEDELYADTSTLATHSFVPRVLSRRRVPMASTVTDETPAAEPAGAEHVATEIDKAAEDTDHSPPDEDVGDSELDEFLESL